MVTVVIIINTDAVFNSLMDKCMCYEESNFSWHCNGKFGSSLAWPDLTFSAIQRPVKIVVWPRES